MLDAIRKRVLEAFETHGAAHTDVLRGFDTETIGREKISWACASAARVEHPRVLVGSFVHGHLPFIKSLRLG